MRDGSHFYAPDGRCVTGLREARGVAGAVPSPTTVLKMLMSHGLLSYIVRQMHEATATTHRLPGMGDDEFFEACEGAADEHSKAAREKGGAFHDWVEGFHNARCMNPEEFAEFEPEIMQDAPPAAAAYAQWYQNYVERSLATELVVFGEGYGGTLDHLCLLRDGRVAITDTKTQDTTKKRGRFTVYPEWAVQLGAYWGAVVRSTSFVPSVLVSVCVGSTAPHVVEAHYYPFPPEHYHRIFLGLLAYWRHANNFHPETSPAWAEQQ